jgi:outer membrane protein OmpA-like peptidoglycan-associated protein
MSRLPLVAAGLALISLAACADHVPARQYVVFFEGEEATLTPTAQQVVAEVEQRARETHAPEIVVEGQADGSSPHAADLAAQRGKTVADAIAASGVPAQTIVQRQGPPGPGGEGVAARKVTIIFGDARP